ncbi:MAG: hypothetical protein J6K16_05305 [Alphaproteobacteria bacterium]|nr:hypothetical protein [Alphaproteobacteria bacterium]
MKKVFLFLTGIILLSAFTACNKINTECELVDYVENCMVIPDTYVCVEKDSTDVFYMTPDTEDFLEPSSSFLTRNMVNDGDNVYVYKCDDNYAVSRININDARAIRSVLKSDEYSNWKIAARCGIALIIALIVFILFSFTDRNSLKFILLAVPIGFIIVATTADVDTVKFVGTGTVTQVENNTVYVDNPNGTLQHTNDICTNEALYEGQEVNIYQFEDTFFASEKRIDDATLKYSEIVPKTWWIYTLTFAISFIVFYVIAVFIVIFALWKWFACRYKSKIFYDNSPDEYKDED